MKMSLIPTRDVDEDENEVVWLAQNEDENRASLVTYLGTGRSHVGTDTGYSTLCLGR